MQKRGSKKAFLEFVRTVKTDSHRYYYIKSTILKFKGEGNDINTQDAFGRTLLHLAIRLNNFRLFKLFVDSGVILDLANDAGDAPIHCCVRENKMNFLKYLVTAGANINMGAEEEQTPLHVAVITGNLEIVKYLIEHGADINLVDERNHSSIDYAIDEKDERILNYLLSKQEKLGPQYGVK